MAMWRWGWCAPTTTTKPSLNAVRCVRADLVIASFVGDLIWNDRGSGARQNFSAWSIISSGRSGRRDLLCTGHLCRCRQLHQTCGQHSSLIHCGCRSPSRPIPRLAAPALSGLQPRSYRSNRPRPLRSPGFLGSRCKDHPSEPLEQLSITAFLPSGKNRPIRARRTRP